MSNMIMVRTFILDSGYTYGLEIRPHSTFQAERHERIVRLLCPPILPKDPVVQYRLYSRARP